MRDEIRRRAKEALKGPARIAAAKGDAATSKSNKKGLPEAVTRRMRMMIMMTMMNQPSMSSRRRQKSFVSMEVLPCILPTAS